MTTSLTTANLPALRIYVINLDASETNLAAFAEYLRASREIEGYWNYVPFSFFIKSRLYSSDLSQRIMTFVPRGNFIIAEVNNFNMQGRLPPAAWNWFYPTPPPAPSAAATSAPPARSTPPLRGRTLGTK